MNIYRLMYNPRPAKNIQEKKAFIVGNGPHGSIQKSSVDMKPRWTFALEKGRSPMAATRIIPMHHNGTCMHKSRNFWMGSTAKKQLDGTTKCAIITFCKSSEDRYAVASGCYCQASSVEEDVG